MFPTWNHEQIQRVLWRTVQSQGLQRPIAQVLLYQKKTNEYEYKIQTNQPFFLSSLRECGSHHLRKDGPIPISKWPQLFKVGAPKAGRVS